MNRMFRINEHPLERVLRVGIGVALVGMALGGLIGGWGFIGVVPIVTGALGTCPVYSLLGVSTCPTVRPSGTRVSR